MALERFEEAIKIAKMGLLSSPREFILKNNLAAAFACLGRTTDADKTLSSIDEIELKEAERATLTATKGIIAFREGKIEVGRALYKLAVEFFRKEKNSRAEALAMFFWAREERLINSPEYSVMQEQVTKMAKRLNLVELLPATEKGSQSSVQSGKPRSETHSEKKNV